MLGLSNVGGVDEVVDLRGGGGVPVPSSPGVDQAEQSLVRFCHVEAVLVMDSRPILGLAFLSQGRVGLGVFWTGLKTITVKIV